MKTIFTLLLIAAGVFCYSQPTISSSVAGGIGDEFSYTNVNTSDFDPGPTGENVTWDFTGISTTGTVVSYTLVDPSVTGQAAEFPGANVASDDGTGAFGFFKITPSEYTLYGVYTPSTTISYSDPEEYWVFPMTYGTSNSDNLHAEFFSGSDFIRDGSNEFLADGYGTLILPSGTFTNVLRVKIEEDYTDEVVGLPYTYEYNFDLYYWFKEGIIGPVFQYFDLEYDIAGIPTATESYGINSNLEITSIENSIGEDNLDIYPNPATDFINIDSPESNLNNASIFDIGGKLIGYQNLSGTSDALDVNALPEGLYVIRILTSNGIFSKTVTIQ